MSESRNQRADLAGNRYRALLTEDDEDSIYRAHLKGVKQSDQAELYNVNQSTISRAIKRAAKRAEEAQ